MNTKRPILMNFRVNEEEKEILQKKMKESGMNQQEYLRNCALDKIIYNFDAIKEVLPELKKQGNNLNQIAKQLNSQQYIEQEKFDKVMKEVSDVWQLLKVAVAQEM